MSLQTVLSRSEDETERLAARLSLWAKPGMAILLTGDLGTGKSTFARAFIHALAGRRDFDVPSPTFTLVQSYDETRVPLFHADLYRLNLSTEINELGISDLLQNQVGLIEWAEKLPNPPGEDCLSIAFEPKKNCRQLTLTATGAWDKALERDSEIEGFVADLKPIRHFLEGDASARRYEWLETPQGNKPILMDMPTRPDGPAVKNGKPYSAIAHLAEGLRSVLHINMHLKQVLGYSAPAIYKADPSKGLALIENLGGQVYGKMLLAGEDMTEPMLTAAALLSDMAKQNWPATTHFSEFGTYSLKPYDEEAILIEADLLPSWFWPFLHGSPAPEERKQSFAAIWRRLVPFTTQKTPQWVLRDFHSPNLIWIPGRKGIQRVGLIDTQDAVLGHAAYDLASLIQDARVDIPEGLAKQTYDYYVMQRSQSDPAFDAEAFATSYAVLGAQRATKILGIFARLSKRDGKHGYLKHMPRVSRALAQNLQHPVLAELKAWYAEHLPQALTVKA